MDTEWIYYPRLTKPVKVVVNNLIKKFVSNGEPGTAQLTSQPARKVFRLLKFVNDLHALINPTTPGTPLPIVLLGKSKNALLSTFLFLDQIVWLGRTGIYENKESAEVIGRISRTLLLDEILNLYHIG